MNDGKESTKTKKGKEKNCYLTETSLWFANMNILEDVSHTRNVYSLLNGKTLIKNVHPDMI